MTTARSWLASCPGCGEGLPDLTGLTGEVSCPGCGARYPLEEGIWRFLPPERERRFAPFLLDYARVRRAEGRGSEDAEYYRRLPWMKGDDVVAWQWSIRARTYEAFVREILPSDGAPLKIVDLGAGVGWLCHHLRELGHLPCAVDIHLDARDGLGAQRHYDPCWPVIQAEFDHLPLRAGQADLVIYSACLHYSTDYRRTLGEALRVLRDRGRIVVMDSPIYRRDRSGRQMVTERHETFRRRYGTPSTALPSVEYLTWGMLRDLERSLRIRFTVHRVWYGVRWALRPVVAALGRRREPSTFAILVAARI
jgi:SAM-dependent methyltransferase